MTDKCIYDTYLGVGVGRDVGVDVLRMKRFISERKIS